MGGSGMKESEGDRLKSTIYESTLSTADAVPLPQWGRLTIRGSHQLIRPSGIAHPYIRGEAATFIPLPYLSRAFIGHPGTARPMSLSLIHI